MAIATLQDVYPLHSKSYAITTTMLTGLSGAYSPIWDTAMREAALAFRSFECWPDVCAFRGARTTGGSARSKSAAPLTDAFAPVTRDTVAYTRYLSIFRSMPRVKILEIGMECGMRFGGGAPAWRAIFGDALELTLIESHAECSSEGTESALLNGVKVVNGDLRDAGLLARVAAERGPFHIIVDGGNAVEKQIPCLHLLFPSALEHGGVYFVEDGHSSSSNTSTVALSNLLDVSGVIVARGGARNALLTRLDGVSAEARRVAGGAQHISFFPGLAVLVRG